MTVKSAPNTARLHMSLAISMAVAGLLAMIVAAALLIELLLAAERLEWHSIGSIAELQRVEPVLLAVEGQEFYLIWMDATPIALSTRDPHRGVCKIRWFGQERLFADACGGTVYLPDGSYHRGPSPRSMDQFAIRVIDERVEVNVTRVTRGRNHS
jgi:hypothetical protein